MQSLTISLPEDLKNFYNFYEENVKYHQLEKKSNSTRNKTSRMAEHKIMAVILVFYLSGYKGIFPNALSYS